MTTYYVSNCGDASCGDPGCVRCSTPHAAQIYVDHENGECERGCEICDAEESDDGGER